MNLSCANDGSTSEKSMVEAPVDVKRASSDVIKSVGGSKDTEKIDYNKKASATKMDVSTVSSSYNNTVKDKSLHTVDGGAVKKCRTGQRFRKQYSVEWPCLVRSNKSDQYVFCTVCS